jgi:hypothetical protein
MNYTGSGPFQCRSPLCPGHKSRNAVPCVGDPPVVLRKDVELARLRRTAQQREAGAIQRMQNVNQSNTQFGEEIGDVNEEATGERLANVSGQRREPTQNDTQTLPQATSSNLEHTDEETLRKVIKLSMEESNKKKSEDEELLNAIEASKSIVSKSDDDFETAIKRSQLEADPDMWLQEAITQSRTDTRGSLHAGLSLATMSSRAKQKALERGEDIGAVSIETTVRSKNFRAEDPGVASAQRPRAVSSGTLSANSATSPPRATPSSPLVPEHQAHTRLDSTTRASQGVGPQVRARRRQNDPDAAPASFSANWDGGEEAPPQGAPPEYSIEANPATEKVRKPVHYSILTVCG